ncbi:hypothetical protein PMI33_02510, partial [Pseudomonas sp. GM67]
MLSGCGRWRSFNAARRLGDIRYFWYGGWWFRPYGESLWKSPKVTKRLLPLSFGGSLMLA